MAVKVRIPTPMRKYTAGVDSVELKAGTVRDLLAELTAKFDGIDKNIYKAPGELNRFVNFYVNDEDIRFLENLDTPVKDGDDFSIVPAVAGG
jgi:molybdopterin synthase sulfur carrier subunit